MPILEPDEVDALLSAVNVGEVRPAPSEQPKAQPYSLVRPQRAAEVHMPLLQQCVADAATSVAHAFSSRTRLHLHGEADGPRLVALQESTFAGHHHVFALIEGDADARPALLAVDEMTARLAVLAALGAGEQASTIAAAVSPGTGFTKAEMQLLRRVFLLVLDSCAGRLTTCCDQPLSLGRVEVDPRLVGQGRMSEVVISFGMHLTGAVDLRFDMALPLEWMKPEARRGISHEPHVLTTGFALDDVELELAVELGRTRMTLRRLVELEVGDVVGLAATESSTLPLCVNGVPKLSGRPQVVGGNLAVVIAAMDLNGRALKTPQLSAELPSSQPAMPGQLGHEHRAGGPRSDKEGGAHGAAA